METITVPTYTLAEVGRALRMPPVTVRAWLKGVRTGSGFFEPVILCDDGEGASVSFRNLVELYVLGAIRRHHGISMPRVRHALRFLRPRFGDHPLATQDLLVHDRELFLFVADTLVNITAQGQQVFHDMLQKYLRRIRHDNDHLPVRLFPVTRSSVEDSPETVEMSPFVQFGRPCLVGTGLPTEVVFLRYQGGDSVEDLANDYDQPSGSILEAIEYERFTRAAAA